MATGYTADLHDGKDVSFNDFILKCTRAMGVAIMQRDESIDSPLREEEDPETYHRDALATAIADLQTLRGLPIDEWRKREQGARAKASTVVLNAIRSCGEIRVRYESMLAEVEAWQPPTPEHQGLKDFMVEQLTTSIRFDCDITYLTISPAVSAEEFKAARIAGVEKDVEYHRTKWESEQVRVDSRNRWVADLRASMHEATVPA